MNHFHYPQYLLETVTKQISAKQSMPSFLANSCTSSEMGPQTSNIIWLDQFSGALIMNAFDELLFKGFFSLNNISPKPYLSLNEITFFPVLIKMHRFLQFRFHMKTLRCHYSHFLTYFSPFLIFQIEKLLCACHSNSIGY